MRVVPSPTEGCNIPKPAGHLTQGDLSNVPCGNSKPTDFGVRSEDIIPSKRVSQRAVPPLIANCSHPGNLLFFLLNASNLTARLAISLA